MGRNSTCNDLLFPTGVDIGSENLKTPLQRIRRVDLRNQKRTGLVVLVVQKVLRQLHSYISYQPTPPTGRQSILRTITLQTSLASKTLTWRKRTRITSPS